MVSAHLDSFWLFWNLDAQIWQPIRKSVHTLPSMDTFLVFFARMDIILSVFLTKYTKKVSILGKVRTAFSRPNSSAKEVWTGFMLSCVNSCPYNSRFVVNFTEISQIYVRKIQSCLRKSRLGLFTFNIVHTLRSLDAFLAPSTKCVSIQKKQSENTLSIHVKVWTILSQTSMN